MQEDQFKNEINKRWRKNSERGRLWAGIFFLLIGGLLLAKTSGAIHFPSWFFTWPMILIGVGLFVGLKHGFKSPAPFILMLIGGVFLADKISDDIYLRPYFWPIVFLAAGVFIIFRPRSSYCKRLREDRYNEPDNFSTAPVGPDETKATWDQSMTGQSDVIDITAIFGGVKKNVLSKSFKGGDIVAIMGGAEVNLSQADFSGKVMIDNFTMFGGTKLIVPNDWDVQSQVVAIFGGVDDKRAPSTSFDPSKVIYLEGTCIFGGIEIRNF